MEMKDVPIVSCDYCHKEIHVEDTHLDQAEVLGAEVKFWACPHCGHRYVVRIYTKEQVQLDEEYLNYAESLARRRRVGLSVNPARMRKLENLRKKAEDFQKGLKDRHLAGVTTLLNQGIDAPNVDLTETIS